MSVPRVKLMELREYVSDRTEATYFSGFLGKAKVVVLRDDRAEITGREKARWSVLLEEQEPRPQSRAEAPDGERKAATPRPRRRDDITAPPPRETAADRRAGDVMREHGIDPNREIGRDEIPF